MRLATLLFGLPCAFLRRVNECSKIHDGLDGISDGKLVNDCNALPGCLALLVPDATGTTPDLKGLFTCKLKEELDSRKEILAIVESILSSSKVKV